MSKTKKSTRSLIQQPRLDPKKGVLTAYDERFLFIPVKLIHSIEDRLVENVGAMTATSFEYEIGKEGGAHYVQLAERAGFKLRSQDDIQKIADSLGTLSGWGKLEVVDFDVPRKMARIRWRNGVSVRNRKGKTPVCHFGRGILTGAIQAILKAPCESIELSCQGKGDSFCEAVFGDPKEVERLADTQKS